MANDASKSGKIRVSTGSIPPLLRWAGSKRKLVPILSGFCPAEFGTYIEPFAGSACLFFHLRPKRAVLGDFNQPLIEMYQCVTSHPRAIANRLATFPTTDDFYYQLRSIPSKSLPLLDRAARFIYLNRFCFNGVFRTNLSGEFNVPRGTKTGMLPSLGELKLISKSLQSAILISSDFETTVARAKAGDLVYLDPPYSAAEVRHRGEYGYGGFSSDDLPRLGNVLEMLDRRGAHFLLSYRCSKSVKQRYAAWHQRTLTVRRHVAGFSEDRKNVREMLISNRPFIRGETP